MQKLLFVFVMFMGVFGFSKVKAQIAPSNNGIFFQAVARDNYSNPAKDRTVYVEASIIQNAANGTKVLTELFQTTTDGLGVFSINIGSGNRIGGTLSGFDKIDWANGPYYLGLKIAIKPLSPVTNWDYTKELIDLGASSFGTVPYAFYSAGTAAVKDQVKISDTAAMLLPYAKKIDLALKVNLADSSSIYVTPTQLRAVKFDTTSIYTVLNQKEIVANKSINVTTDATSDIKYPSVRAVKSYVDLQFSNFVLADGSVTTAKIADAAVTDAKIVSVAGSKVSGDIAGNAATATNATLAATATKLATPRTINGVAFDGTSNITIATGSTVSDADANTKGIIQLNGDLTGTAAQPRIANGAITDAKIVSVAGAKVSGDIAGNAATATLAANATKLATPRTINGVAFDGTSNITIATGSNPIDADANTKGIVQLAGDLTGTAAQPRIANGAVTNAKIADVAASKITGAVAVANGGTGATTAAGARTNLGLVIGTDVLAQRSFGSAANNSTTDFIAATDKGANNGVATLGNDGKIPSTQIPAISFQSASVVSNQAAMLALANQQVGSIAIRTDNNKNYVLSSLPATTLANWIELATPSSVTSVNGNAGPNVVLTATDIAGVELASNKSNDVVADAASTTKFPTVKSIKDYVDQQSANAGVADNSITSAKINGAIAIAKGGTGATTAAGARTNLGLVIGTDVMSATATTTLTGDVTGSGNGSFATTVNSVGGVSSNTIATLPTSVNANTASITAEITRATNAEATLDTRITSNTTSITAEITRATNVEAALDTRVTSNTASITANANNISSLTTNVNANTASITAEITRATNAEAALDTKITSNTASITTNTADIILKAPINSPTFTGTPTAPTPATSDNSTKVATTEYVKNSITAASAGLSTIGAISGTSNAKGATISGTTELILTPADVTNGGVVTTGAQTFAGAKTFSNTATFGTDITVNGLTVGKGGGNNLANTAIGLGALALNSSGSGSTAFGYKALSKSTAGYATAFGTSALENLTTGTANVAIGYATLNQTSSQNSNTAVGDQAMRNSTGANNTVLGASALSGAASQTNGNNNTAIGTFVLRNATTAAFNVGVGSNSLNNMTTGNDNTVLGYLSGYYAGAGTSTTLTSMSQGVLIGSNVRTGTNTSTNEIAIGYNVVGNGSNTVTIGNYSNTANYFRGDINLTGNVIGGTWSGTTISAAKGGTGLTSPGASGNILTSDGTNWVSSAPAVSGVSTLAYSTTGSSNGGTISGTTLTLTAADGTNPGLISTGTQSIAGAKTFSNDVTATNFLGNATTATTAGNITATSNTTLTSLSNLNTVGTITTGTWSGTTIAVANGGTGRTSITDGQILFGNGTSALGTNSNLMWNNTDGSFGIGTSSPGSGFNTKLDVVGNSSFRMNGINRALKFDGYSPSGSLEVSRIYTDATNGTPADFVLGTYPNGHLNQLYLKQSNGFVGIRNSSPASALDVNGTVTATAFSGTLTGNASSATALATGRTISTTGDVTFTSGAFDGTSNVTGSATLTNTTVTAGTYGSSTAIPTFTVDSKGRLTAASTVGITAGVSTLAYSTSSAANGGTISGTTLTLAAADGTNPGLISTGTQTIAGAKTFSNDVTATNFLGNATTATTAGNITATSNTTLTSLSNLNTVGTITSGTWSGTTIGSNVGGAGTVNGLLKANGSGVVSAAVAGTDYQGALTAGSGISISAGTISATGLTTSNLASNAAITNSQLANSSTTLGSTTMTLGGTVTSVTGLTSLTATTLVGTLSGTATTATNITGGAIGAIPYQSSAGTTAILSGNTSSTVMYLTSSGNGIASTAPTWATLNAIPYTGATAAVDLGSYDLKVNGLTVGRGKSAVSTNTAVGSGALNANTSGYSNSAFGNNALLANTDGYSNSGFGSSALSSNISGDNNTALGYEALKSNTTGDDNVAIGYLALSAKTAAGSNVAIGSLAMSENNATFYRGVAVGTGSLRYTNGSDNVAIGSNAGGGLGFGSVTGGVKNIFIGTNAGYGFGSGATPGQNTTGNSSVLIGHDVRAGANGQTNQIVISGYTGTEGTIGLGTNTTLIGNSATTTARIMGALNLPNNTSSSSSTTGALTVGGGAGIAGSLNVGGSATISSTLTAGATTLASLSISGNETVGGTLGVTGATTLSTLTASGNSTLTTLTTTGAATFSSTVSIPTGAGLNKVLVSDANGGATWNSNPNAAFRLVSSSATYTVSATDDKYVIYSNAALGTISLPSITSTMSGKEIIIKNISNFNVTINANGSQKIVADFANNAATSATLGVEASNNWVKLIADGTNNQWILFRALF